MKIFTLLLLQWLSLFLSGFVLAQTADSPSTPGNPASVSDQGSPAYVAQARKTIDTVLAEPAFSRTRTIKVPKPKESSDPHDDRAKKTSDDRYRSPEDRSKKSSSSFNLDQFFAQTGQIVLWVLIFGLVVLLVIYSKHWLPFLGWQRQGKPLPTPVHLSGSALETPEALPEDIITAAERYWREGKKDEALSLLYRGVIELLEERYRIELPQGATEEEIRRYVSNAMPSFKDDFSNIARAWLRLAYAHRAPADIANLLAGFSRLQQVGGAAS
ncbi:MAG: DUF4129 domain-containing protein [Azoarcus sp.]|jgi:hypothetical protein|nr:DUF4129 domain-containing protein [Azoarcus sp.]